MQPCSIPKQDPELCWGAQAVPGLMEGQRDRLQAQSQQMGISG